MQKMSSLPTKLNAMALVHALKRAPAEHKGDAGKAILVGGAPGMSGALLLAGNACLHLGAGWIVLEMLDPQTAHACLDHPEMMIRLANSDASAALVQQHPDAIAIGPGLGKSTLAQEWLMSALNLPNTPLVIDADAITSIAHSPALLALLKKRNEYFPGKTVLTPHPGEAAQLLSSSANEIQCDRLDAMKQLVQLTQSIVILKGQHTLIASPQHRTTQCEEGNPGMGTGGMGDVLTGSIAALAAQGVRHGLDLWSASCIGVQLHALAADTLVAKGVGPIGLTPSEVILEMRTLLNQYASTCNP